MLDPKRKNLYMKDDVVKKLFTSTEEGREYLTKIICKVLEVPADCFKINVIHSDIGVNQNVVNSQADIVAENDEVLVNVEINSNKSESKRVKNDMYICQLLLKQIKSSKDYVKKLKKVHQINLNAFDIAGDGRFIVVSKILDVKTCKELHPLLEIHDINLEKLQNMDYTSVNEDKESLEYLLYILICNDKVDIDTMYDGDELMAKIVDVAHSITDDFDKRFYYDEEEVKRLEFQAGMEKGIKQGVEQGIEQEKSEIAKNMLEKNCDVDFISEITNLSIEDIQKLKDEPK